MKSFKKIIWNNYKLLIGTVIGGVIATTGVYAAIVLQSSSVGYTDTYSIGATTVQNAIDKLNTKATTKINEALAQCPDGYICIKPRVWISGSSVCAKPSNSDICYDQNTGTTPSEAQFSTSSVSWPYQIYSTGNVYCKIHMSGKPIICGDSDAGIECASDTLTCTSI